MNELAELHCSPVSATTPRFEAGEIKRYNDKLPDWQVDEKDHELQLAKSFKFDDFKQAVDFTNRVARIADEEDHHPAIMTEWGKVTVSWWTHKIRGLHLNDFIMAAKTDQLYDEMV